MFHNNNGRLEEKGFRKPDIRSGEGWSRFGTAVTNLGDLNHDGLQDVGVGAPGQDGGGGAVYIYHGKRMPLLLDNSRKKNNSWMNMITDDHVNCFRTESGYQSI